MVTKTVHYRKFEPVSDDWTKGTLQQLLAGALNAACASGKSYLEDWEARRLPVTGDEGLIRFLHNIQRSDESIFGTMCLFLPDDWAVVMRVFEEQHGEEHKTLDETLRELEIAERPPGDGEDYLRGIAYWLVVKDHLFVVQHTSIQTKAFEDYFSELFLASGVLAAADRFAFRLEFNRDLVGGDLANISAVEIGGVVNKGTPTPTIAQEEAREVEEQRTLGHRLSRFEKAVDILKAMFGEPNAEAIIANIPPEAELEVDVRFGYKTKRRDVSREVLRDIARAARNLPDGEVVAFGKDGKQVGDDLRLSAPMPFRLIRNKGSLLDLDDARVKLLRVYQRFVEDNKIEA